MQLLTFRETKDGKPVRQTGLAGFPILLTI